MRGCHPEPTVAVTAVATVLALAVGRGPVGALLVAAAVLAGQLSIGWSNDWWDAARDRAAGRPDKPTATGAVPAGTLRTSALAAAVATVPLSLLSGLLAGTVHLVAVTAGWLYNRPLKATPASVLPYLVAFGLLPAFVVLGLPGGPLPPWWLCLAAALLGAGAHFFNTLPDLADDRAGGIRGLPHRLGARASWLVGGLLLVAASSVLALGPTGPPTGYGLTGLALAVAALLAGAVAARRSGSRAAFRTVLLIAVVDVTLLVLAGTSVR